VISAAGGVVKENLRVLQLQVCTLSVMAGEVMITRDNLEKKKIRGHKLVNRISIRQGICIERQSEVGLWWV
jgi:hypothetical protein